MSNLPPIPQIEGNVDIVLDLFTHQSLRVGGATMNDDYGDTERLAELGNKVLDLVVTTQLFKKKPLLSAQEMMAHKCQVISDENLDYWLNAYNLKTKLRFAPGQADAINSPDEIRRFFNTYVGAVYIRNGLPALQKWISALIDPNADTTDYAAPQPQFNYWPPPAPPTTAPPPLPAYTPTSNPPGGGVAVSSLVSLALVNQTAVQKGFQVTYPAEQIGLAHQPLWTVRCCLNGQERGRGQGKSQKIAKEEAARQAWAVMGWGPRA